MIVHRLDMATSGLLLIAKTKEVHQHLQAQFEEGKMIIQYDALVESELKREKIDYSRESLKLKKAFRHVEFGHTHTHAN